MQLLAILKYSLDVICYLIGQDRNQCLTSDLLHSKSDIVMVFLSCAARWVRLETQSHSWWKSLGVKATLMRCQQSVWIPSITNTCKQLFNWFKQHGITC